MLAIWVNRDEGAPEDSHVVTVREVTPVFCASSALDSPALCLARVILEAFSVMRWR